MHGKTIKQLLNLKDDLNSVIEIRGEKVLDSTNKSELQEDLQRNIIDYITETIEQIDLMIDNIESGEYDQTPDEEFDDY
jgi:hypothetical protein